MTIVPMAHPGPSAPARIVSVMARSQHHNVVLPPGAGLLDALDDIASRLGVESAQVELLGRTIEQMS